MNKHKTPIICRLKVKLFGFHIPHAFFICSIGCPIISRNCKGCIHNKHEKLKEKMLEAQKCNI